MITKNKSGHLYIENSKNCKYLSFFEYVDKKGDIFSNILILSKKQYFEK